MSPRRQGGGMFTEREWKEGGKLLLLGWNPGTGARNLGPLLSRSGYDVLILNEMWPGVLADLAPGNWEGVCEGQQLVAARAPRSTVMGYAYDAPKCGCRWLLARVSFEPAKCNISGLTICSVHLNSWRAKKVDAGPWHLLAALDGAAQAAPCGRIDVISGDINMSRWSRSRPTMWNEQVLDGLEARGFVVAADDPNECCFMAVRAELAQDFKVRGSRWEARKSQAEYGMKELLAEVGAKSTSEDVHWPFTVSLRPVMASTGFRLRTADSKKRRKQIYRKRQHAAKAKAAAAGGQGAALAVPWPAESSSPWGWAQDNADDDNNAAGRAAASSAVAEVGQCGGAAGAALAAPASASAAAPNRPGGRYGGPRPGKVGGGPRLTVAGGTAGDMRPGSDA